MHKFFATPLFLGKKIIFLTECPSTNDELMRLVRDENPIEGTIVYTDYQLRGKGQRGNIWSSERKKNLLMSILIKPRYLAVAKQYLLNVAVGLGVIKCISKYLIKNSSLSLKWPNDIYLSGRKLGGILIENVLRDSVIESTVLGLGINLNQDTYEHPIATSIKIETGNKVDRTHFMETLLSDIAFYLLKLKEGQEDTLMELYHAFLYKRNVKSVYRDSEGEFEGVIQGVNHQGRLIIEKNGHLCDYGIKEIEFII